MIGDLRTVMRRYMRLVESSDPYVYHVTPAEPLSARGLMQRYGGREVEFRNLAPLAEQAIRTRAAEHLDPGAQPQIKPKMRMQVVFAMRSAVRSRHGGIDYRDTCPSPGSGVYSLPNTLPHRHCSLWNDGQ
jgi:hypothetical protein